MSKVLGVPHMDSKVMKGIACATGGAVGLPGMGAPALPKAPRNRQNALNIRVAPLKRLTPQAPPIKPQKFGFTE